MEDLTVDQSVLAKYPVHNTYSDLSLEESARDLLTSPAESHVHPQHHITHLRHTQHHQERQILEPSQLQYVQQSHSTFSTLPETPLVSHYDYVNEGVSVLIAQPCSDMRSGPGARGGSRVEEGLSTKRGWKRKKEDKNEETSRQQNKLDSSQRCDVCGEQASGHYFGALVCLPCKSFFIRCTKDGRPNFSNQCGGKCDVLKGGRVRCQHCRFQKCIHAGMYRKEKPEAVEPAEGQLLCKVCGDIANGVHFGVTTCEGCKKFFRRGLKENKSYTCKANMHCSINPRMRNNCRYCRYQKCLYEGMSREAIKMGRPKKGEIPYRKTVKKNGVKQLTKSFDKQASSSNRSSLSSEYDQDDMSTSGDVFDNTQSQQIHLSQQPLQQQHQHNTFSLGTLLHDCMTVEDWDQKVEMTGLEAHHSSAHSVTTSTAVVDINENVTTGVRQISPLVRNVQHEMVSINHSQRIHPQQQQQDHHQIHLHPIHPRQQQQLDDIEELPRAAHHQMNSFQEHNQNTENYQVLPGLDFDTGHELPENRAIKVESASIQDNVSGSLTETVILENMQNIQGLKEEYHSRGLKEEYHSFTTHSDNNAAYSLAEQRAATVLANCATVLPVSPLESQLVAINMYSPNIIYTPQGQELIIIHNTNQSQSSANIILNQDKQDSSNINMDRTLERTSQELNHAQDHQGHLVDNLTVLNQAIIRSNPVIDNVSDNYHGLSRNSMFNDISDLQNQQYSSESNSAESPKHMPSPRSRQLNDDGNESSYTVLSSKCNISDSLPTNLSFSSDTARFKRPGIRSPIAAILQQHREAIQAGRPVHLSSEEIEELLNTVNSDQARGTQRLINNHSLFARNQRDVIDQVNLNIQQQSANAYVVADNQQEETSQQFHRQTDDVRHYLNKSPYPNINHFTGVDSLNSTVSQDRQFETHSQANSGSAVVQEMQRCNFSNNNNNQISHYLSLDNTDQMNDLEPYDDSFNSSLFRDSTLLHEINRIFLGIDNSCSTYGCNRSEIDRSRTEDGTIYALLSPDDYSPEISHTYWHGFQQSDQPIHMTPDKEKIIKDVLDAFDNLQKTYVTNEPEYISKKIPQDQLEHWHHIQRRIARHVVAGQRFCRNIPGYFKLDIQDRISLGKHVGFGLMVLIACTEFYDSEYRRFKYIWNWTMPMQNPLHSYKVHLLDLGDRIHDIEMDRTEASMLCAISMTSIDCPGLVQPDIVCIVRDVLLDALKAHIATKTVSTKRLQDLLSIMPQVRLMTVWYNNLMKKMSVPSDLINNKNKLQP
ncbi:uncharacterized protein LOC106057102 isoform X4 [Biomphalaria glabrata]|uniref:Uncharacterized protein LOC106057102 isoform X4 n=1 Tax=Biomphalaria glabrata TaxID=6526 RepID=A0A9W2ZZQ7_BIOGL|nr:uncharacterized protein LOC106057102 isoform X4 [Biomphalaria glabrata]